MNRRVSGFTLVEVVIALAVLAVAFFGLISVITYTTRMNMATKERMLAMRAAEKKIEQMLGCSSFDDIYNTFKDQSEGLGWEQVDGLEPVSPPPVAPPPDAPLAYSYPITGARPVLFVRFPVKAGGTFDEAGTGKFIDNKDSFGNFVDLDLNGNNKLTDVGLPIAQCKILPVSIEVYWRGTVGPGKKGGGLPEGNTSLIYRYTFLRKS